MSEETVKVIVRVRPFTEKENAKQLPEFIDFDHKEKQLFIENVNNDSRKNKIFCFDDIFSEESTQDEIYESAASSLVNEVIEGYNGTIFAYGQTGSGKTYTMMGNSKSEENRGIIPRCFKEILQRAKSSAQKEFLILCSFVELYNEEIRDLLTGTGGERGNSGTATPNGSGSLNKLELRESPEYGIFIKDMKKNTITNEKDFERYLKQGTVNRKTSETLMNIESSRSHAIFTIYVESLDKSEDQERLIGSKFNFVDLAGSERQSKTNSTGDRFLEATKINLSLTALGKVISSLVEGKGSHIPYRDSKLTRLLQDSLGGNAKTVMIATVSPSFYNYDETLSTLKYASRAKYITNVPIINRDPKDALLLEYENEIKRLQNQLKEIQSISENEKVDLLKEENRRISKEHEKEKTHLMCKINNLQDQLISSPDMLSAEYFVEREKREQKLTFMEQNYKNLEEEVDQMRGLLSELRRKYKNASKEIFQLETEHEREREIIEEQCSNYKRENLMYKGVLNVLFTEKQLKNLLSLGSWECDENQNEKYKLPTFYFKDRHTLAFPCEDSNNGIEETHRKKSKEPVSKSKENRDRDRDYNRSRGKDINNTTMTSLGVKVAMNALTNRTNTPAEVSNHISGNRQQLQRNDRQQYSSKTKKRY